MDCLCDVCFYVSLILVAGRDSLLESLLPHVGLHVHV